MRFMFGRSSVQSMESLSRHLECWQNSQRRDVGALIDAHGLRLRGFSRSEQNAHTYRLTSRISNAQARADLACKGAALRRVCRSAHRVRSDVRWGCSCERLPCFLSTPAGNHLQRSHINFAVRANRYRNVSNGFSDWFAQHVRHIAMHKNLVFC